MLSTLFSPALGQVSSIHISSPGGCSASIQPELCMKRGLKPDSPFNSFLALSDRVPLIRKQSALSRCRAVFLFSNSPRSPIRSTSPASGASPSGTARTTRRCAPTAASSPTASTCSTSPTRVPCRPGRTPSPPKHPHCKAATIKRLQRNPALVILWKPYICNSM